MNGRRRCARRSRRRPPTSANHARNAKSQPLRPTLATNTSHRRLATLSSTRCACVTLSRHAWTGRTTAQVSSLSQRRRRCPRRTCICRNESPSRTCSRTPLVFSHTGHAHTTHARTHAITPSTRSQLRATNPPLPNANSVLPPPKPIRTVRRTSPTAAFRTEPPGDKVLPSNTRRTTPTPPPSAHLHETRIHAYFPLHSASAPTNSDLRRRPRGVRPRNTHARNLLDEGDPSVARLRPWREFEISLF